MKIHTFGSDLAAGPYSGFYRSSIAIETDKSLYFFDVGQSSANTAYLNGVDLLKTRAIFISHPNTRHTEGVGSLLYYIDSSATASGRLSSFGLYIPAAKSPEETALYFDKSLKNISCELQSIDDGLIYDDGELSVEAIHIRHTQKFCGRAISYAFRIVCEGKMIVFSGDMRLEDIKSILPARADIFLAETGHHKIESICHEMALRNKSVKNLLFVHRGSYVMARPQALAAEAEPRGPYSFCAYGSSGVFDV